jgi:hypothetical protein
VVLPESMWALIPIFLNLVKSLFIASSFISLFARSCVVSAQPAAPVQLLSKKPDDLWITCGNI